RPQIGSVVARTGRGFPGESPDCRRRNPVSLFLCEYAPYSGPLRADEQSLLGVVRPYLSVGTESRVKRAAIALAFGPSPFLYEAANRRCEPAEAPCKTRAVRLRMQSIPS